jgi:hypothetical protein
MVTLFKRHLFVLAFILLFLATSMTFHHGWADYDQTKVLNLTGEILESSYENPHGIIKLKTKDKTWTAVLAPPSRMENRGLKKEMLKVGETATVVGYPHKTEKDEMRVERITIGKTTTELR